MQSLIENLTNTETQKQGLIVPPPPLKPRKQKDPEDCYLSFIDQIQDGDYGSAKLVRKEPRTNRDIYFKFRPRKSKPTEMKSYRRDKTHRSVVSYRTKTGGAKRENIAFMNCSFLELDGSTDGTLKTIDDVLTLARNNNFLEGLQTSVTSPGNFHLIWDYNNPLPWKPKNESYWLSVQKRLIQLFKRAGFLVDKMASLNPCQNLRNPSQLNPYNFKRRCKVEIHKSYSKTSLRRLYRALNKTSIPNPRPLPASVKLRRFSRANKGFTATHAELAITLGTCTKTAQREVSKAVANGDLRIVQRTGNNKGIKRTTEYTSNLYIEPNSQKGHLSICKNNSLPAEVLLRDFKRVGTETGKRNKALFALGLFLKHRLGKQASLEAIRGELLQGAMRCHVSIREFERTLRNVMKSAYSNPFSLPKLRAWELVEGTGHFH